MELEDERNWERLTPYEQIVDLHFDYGTGERRCIGATIDDRLYGVFEFDCTEPGDAAIIDLIYSEPIQRLGLIEQLTLPKQYATKPEAADFTRLEHSIGTMLLTRKLGGSHEQQIRALLHDAAVTAFSHLGDWLQQGMGGADSYHDSIQTHYLKQWGVDKLLAEHGFDLGEIIDHNVKDFVERDGPDLCVDRVDYALREFIRWTCPEEVPSLIDDLAVAEDMIVFKSQQSARIFSHNYLKLYSQHWAEPEHAVREKLLFEQIKYGLDKGILNYEDMYVIDSYVMVKLELWGDKVTWFIEGLLGSAQLSFQVLNGPKEAFSRETFIQDKTGLYFEMSDFKRRWVDPSIVDEDGHRTPLSWIDGDHRRETEAFQVTTSTSNLNKGRFQEDDQVQYVRIEVDEDVKNWLLAIDGFM